MSTEIPFIDLDQLESPPIVLIHEGVKYEMQELTLKGFIAAVQKAKRASVAGESSSGEDSEQMLKDLISTISESFPTLPKEKLAAMEFRKIGLIMNFIMEANNPEGTEVGDGKKGEMPKNSAN